MKMVELKNVGNVRISIRQVRGFALDPGESKKVPPATAAHPAVKRFVGRGLELVEASKEEPKAPAPPSSVKKSEPKPEPQKAPEPKTESEKDAGKDEDNDTEKTSGNDLREDYLSAPGVTEENVDGLLEAFPTKEALSKATKDAVGDLGVSKSYAKRLISWAKE